MTNKAIARHLKLAADLLTLTGGNDFRARAFANAARTVDRMDEPAAGFSADELTTVRGIGKGLARDVREIVETGTLSLNEKTLHGLPPGLPEVMRVRGLGPKKVRAMWQELGVASLEDVERVAASGELASLSGFGAKTVQNVLERVEELKAYRGRALYAHALTEAEAARDALRRAGHRAEIAGALRRQCQIVDRAVLVTDATPEAADAALADWGMGAGAGALPLGLPLAVVSAPQEAFGTALWRETGSEAHLGLWRERFGDPPEAADEAAVFEAAGVPVVPPALREGTWEIEAAASGALPALVTVADLAGTLHNHSTWSDGAHTLREMAEHARGMGLGYYGIGDHSRSLTIAHGLSIDELREQTREAAALNEEYAAGGLDFRVLTGSECDILQDGAMDFPDEVLADLDVVVASVHTHFAMSEDEATARIVRAVENPHVDILGHATGRLLLRREGYPLDVEAVLDACAVHGTAIELNANPRRLDLDWRHLRAAQARGVPVAINPDAHAAEGLEDVRWGVAAAQKAGLTAADVLNARPREALLSR